MDNEFDADALIKIIEKKHEELESEFRPADDFNEGARFVKNLDPKVVELYTGVRKVLAEYRSGQLPKAFKVIPTLSNWEQILQLTSPNKWTAASMYAATKIFSSMREDMAQRFYNIILLPRLRDDIAEYKKLNHHLYQALMRALYKPGAFFKGIILPLCEDSDNGTLREAVCVASILPKKHIPILHSAAALLKIAELPFSAYNCIFMHALISKNYALPVRVVSGLVDFFLRFKADPEARLPVSWHQLLLLFCKLYSNDMEPDQRDYLMDLIRVHSHHQVTPVIRAQLMRASQPDAAKNVHDDPMGEAGQYRKSVTLADNSQANSEELMD